MKQAFSIYNRTSRQILCDLIYFSSGFVLPDREVKFGRPVPEQPLHGDPWRRDTMVEVTMRPTWHDGHRIRGSKAFWYRRIDLASIVPLRAHAPPPPITAYPFDTYSLLPAINGYYGLKLGKRLARAVRHLA